ncbi:MAG TPA: ABC transporter permease [Thermoanaerobaculia bacterium]|nr:ABC transporter permease [Thermoanaerobaculia bacterium]
MNVATIKLAFRVLARRKVFTAISLVGITLTLVVLVVATAILDNAFAPHAPQSRLGRTLFVSHLGQYGPNMTELTNPGRGFLDATVRGLEGAERVTYFTDVETAVVYQGGRRMEAPLRRADPEYWRVFDFRFLEGTPFTAADESANRSIVVITDELRQQLFGHERALGRSINIGGQMVLVTGVVPRASVAQILAFGDVFMPLGPPTDESRLALTGNLLAGVLAKSSDDIVSLKKQFAMRVARVPLSDPKAFKEMRSGLDTPFEMFADNATHYRFGERAAAVIRAVFFTLAVLFMTLPALNLITLNLSRILERAPEVGVRKAFGAPKRMLIGQFVTENVILTLLGGAIAFGAAFFVLRALERIDLIPGIRFTLNLQVFFYAMLIAGFFGVFSGAYPAWRMSRLNPAEALRGGGI